jgi:hypothetical protein
MENPCLSRTETNGKKPCHSRSEQRTYIDALFLFNVFGGFLEVIKIKSYLSEKVRIS